MQTGSSYVEQKRLLAETLFKEGLNCAQAVYLAFCEESGMDRETALRISSGFGGGVSRLREICGALSGAVMVVGMKYGGYNPKDQEAKAAHYARVQSLAHPFRDENGSWVCRELLALPEGASDPTPEARTETYYRLRPCAAYVGSAAAILADFLEREGQV